jgi:hypothetical protein
MTNDDTRPDMTKVSRPVHGPRPIASVVPLVAKVAFGRGAPGIARLMEAWPGIMGPFLANVTTPRYLSQGTLTIGCTGPVAMELQFLSGELIARISQYLGSQPVQRLRFVQTGSGRLLVRPSPQPTSQSLEAARLAASEAVGELADGPLREALAALGRAVITESASRLGK